MRKIEETLKRIAADTSKVHSPTSSNIDQPSELRSSSMFGDPNCPICHGVGFVRRDLPIGHPDFGRLTLCTCSQGQAVQAARQRLYQLSNLESLSGLTFESFQPHGRVGMGDYQSVSLEQAYNHARQFASSLNGWLLLTGNYGCGKTHLAAAVANFAVSLGVPTLFITVPDLLDWLRYSYGSSETSFETRFEEIRQITLLILDDFGTQNATPWAQEKLFQILNTRYISRLPTIITTNLAMDEIEERIRSRMSDPELVTRVQILAPDFRNPKDDSGHPELSSLSLHSQRTFGNFSLRHGEGLTQDDLLSLKKAFEAAKSFAENPAGWLVLTGGYGCGKTHLAAAIANHRVGLGFPPIFVVVPDLLDHLRASFNPNSGTTYDRRFEDVKTDRLLILDDLGTQSATPWAREKLYQLFNYRYNAELPTVITTANKLEEIDPRILSRMLDKRLCKINGIIIPAYRGGSRPEKPQPGHRTRRTTV
ncbi:MAG TPA: ATP-binding protein [Anaerolineaceae bacterium]|jgi:DNA replication protein DnaC